MDICKTNECDFAAITRLVREHPFFDFCFTFDAQENLVGEYYAERLKKNFLSPDRFFFTAKENGSVSGVVSVRKLGWDTEFFKYPMGSLEDLCFLAGMNKSGAGLVQAATGFGKDMGLSHLSAKVNTRDVETVHLLENEGFRHMDSIVFYVIEQKGSQKKEFEPDGEKVVQLKTGQEEAVFEIARKAFSTYVGRFQNDRSMPPHSAADFYLKWLKTSWENNRENIFVSEKDGALSGFAIWDHDTLFKEVTGKSVFTLSLIGVLPEKGNRGVAARIINFGRRFNRDADYFLIPVHINNIAMQRSAVGCGARLVSSRHTFHMGLLK